MSEQQATETQTPQIHDQARDQTGATQVRLRLDDRKLTTTYSNAFRTSTSAEEVIIDFGMNQVIPAPSAPGPDGQRHGPQVEMLFELNNRIVLNYFTAKRLAMMLSQAVHGYENRFGEIKLNANDRLRPGAK